jgi:hypothetical protein
MLFLIWQVFWLALFVDAFPFVNSGMKIQQGL